MLSRTVLLCCWWVAARLGLCLAGIGSTELQRLMVRRLQWISLSAGGAALFVVLAGSLAGGLPSHGAAAKLYLVPDGAAAVLCLVALLLWRYSQRKLRQALQDQASDPLVLKGAVRRVIIARDGGWPLLVRDQGGRWLWLTGSPRALAPVQGRLTSRAAGRQFQLTVVLTYHPRSRVVQEITGMAVEQLEAAWKSSPAFSVVPTRVAGRMQPALVELDGH